MGQVKVQIIGRIYKPYITAESKIGTLIKFSVGVGYKVADGFSVSFYYCTAFPDRNEMAKNILDGKQYPLDVEVSGRQTISTGKDGKTYVNVAVESIAPWVYRPAAKADNEQKHPEGYKMKIGTGRLDKPETKENPPVPSDIDDNELPF